MALRCYNVGNACIERITKRGAKCPHIPEYDKRRRSPKGLLSAVVQVQFFMSVILKKTALPGETPKEVAKRPCQGWDASGTKFDTLANPHERTMSDKK
jgi:hypothetical protein